MRPGQPGAIGIVPQGGHTKKLRRCRGARAAQEGGGHRHRERVEDSVGECAFGSELELVCEQSRELLRKASTCPNLVTPRPPPPQPPWRPLAPLPHLASARACSSWRRRVRRQLVEVQHLLHHGRGQRVADRRGTTVQARPTPPLSQETRTSAASNYYRNYFNISRALRGATVARASASRGFCARSFVLEPDLHLPRCQSCHVRELNAPFMARVLRPAPRLRRRREEFCVENRAFVDLRRRTLLRPLRPLRPLRRPLGLQHLQARRRTRRCGRCGRTGRRG